ncbi:hypothetical protein BD410DRAFT_366995 [Rickenella mellea]|uniref:F-box domain-containing protein n=1 Tax=Rickenella mellea TaxID=50990 RepID=A0A4Y7PYT6_9AGAM|nr:hypothetical protein BD410DRAFT_366995 [Rickenella mellea]
MLSALPTESVVNILSFFLIHQIHRLQLVSRAWNLFIRTNESIIYGECAILHRFTQAGVLLCDARGSDLGPWLDDLKSWKDLCQRWYRLESNWEGVGRQRPVKRYFGYETLGVHRLKVDEEHRFVISTHQNGGLVVFSMDQDRVLFRLSSNYVPRGAHVEYADGYMIFDCLDATSLEVWRLQTPTWDGTQVPSDPPNRCRPHPTQTHASNQEVEYRDPSGQGCFSPWAHICPPTDMCAFRFVYPTLLVGSLVGQAVYLFDIPSATLVQRVLLNEHRFFTEPDAFLPYLELGQRHIFVCTVHGILIVPRSNPTINVVAEFPGPEPHMRIRALSKEALQVTTYSGNAGGLVRCIIREPTLRRRVSVDDLHAFAAVHVSPDGKDFAAIDLHGLVFLVKDFDRVIQGECTFSDVTVQIQLDGPATSLAFEYGRVAVKTTDGVFIINLDSSYHGIFRSSEPFAYRHPLLPHLTITKLGWFTYGQMLKQVTVLQMTKTAVWLNWAPLKMLMPINRARTPPPLVCAIDFRPR